MSVHEFPSLSRQRYGNRLKAWREDLHLTREQLAEKVGVTLYDVREMEWGYRLADEIEVKIITYLEENTP